MGGFFLGPLWNWRNKALNDFALLHLETQPDDLILEVGFGGGYLIRQMAKKVQSGLICGVDLSNTLVKKAKKKYGRKKNNITFECSNAKSLPFPNNNFTKACSVNSIFYWDAPMQALREMYRVLMPNGRFVLVMTDKNSLKGKGFAKTGLNLFESQEVVDMLHDAGFSEIMNYPSFDRFRDFTCYVAIKR